MMTLLEYEAMKIKIERENEEKLKHYPILEKQLAIAVEVLNEYADLNNWIEICDGKCTFESISGTEDHLAQDALQQIKELEKDD